MSALPALSPLQIVPAPRPRLTPAPLPGHGYPPEDLDARFVQDWLEFDEHEDDEPTPRLASPLPEPESVAGPLANAVAIPLVSVVVTPLALIAVVFPVQSVLEIAAWLVEWLLTVSAR